MKTRLNHSSVSKLGVSSHPARSRSLHSSAVAIAVGALVACAEPAVADPAASLSGIQRSQQAIIGAPHANSPELNHTGALLSEEAFGATSQFCTGTLIGPTTVVTAKHCVLEIPFLIDYLGPVHFAIGPDAAAPVEKIPIVWVETAPGDAGGFVGLGRDVAVVHLEYPSTLTPAKPRLLVGDWVGTPMMAIGYGVYNTAGAADQQRRIGRVTIGALDGSAFHALFGSFDAFLAPDTAEDFADDPAFLAFLRRLYDGTTLYERHEAVVGTASADVQTCFGDSGGPLARFSVANGWETYGVVSGGVRSERSVCDQGTVYSTFGPETLAFLEEQMAWVDPCGDVTSKGECDGDVARRCYTNFGANIRRIVEENCSASGLACTASEASAGCGGVLPPPPASNEVRQRARAAIARALRPSTVLDEIRRRTARAD